MDGVIIFVIGFLFGGFSGMVLTAMVVVGRDE